MGFSIGMQCGAHTVTAAEDSAGTLAITLNMVNPVSYQIHAIRSGAEVSMAGAVLTLAVGTETTGTWSNGTLTVADGTYVPTTGDILYWMAG